MAKCPDCGKMWYCNHQDIAFKLNECPICRCLACREMRKEEEELQVTKRLYAEMNHISSRR